MDRNPLSPLGARATPQLAADSGSAASLSSPVLDRWRRREVLPSLKWPAIVGVIAGVSTGGASVVCEHFGCDSFLVFMLAWCVAALAAAVGSLALPFLAYRVVRLPVARLVVSCATLVTSAYATDCLRWPVRRWAFGRLAERSRPLVEAIDAYCVERGHPPECLAELVPAFLPEVPRTGMSAYPDYQYSRIEAPDPGALPWRLAVPCSLGPFNWDDFYYAPQRELRRPLYRIEDRLGDWVYFHE